MKQLLFALLTLSTLCHGAAEAPRKHGIKRKAEEPYNAHVHALEKQQADIAQAQDAITTIIPKDIARIIAQYAIAYGVVFDLTPYITTRETLDLSKHCITAIIVNPRKAPDVLRTLDLSNNLLTTVPSRELAGITSLTGCDLSNNEFDEEAEKEREWLYQYFQPGVTFGGGPRTFAFYK